MDKFNVYLINYNMNDQIDQNYKILLKSFSKNNLHILDNGSDKKSPHKSTSIFLKENIKISGAFRYIWDREIKNNSNIVVTITSSATLLDEDYYKNVLKSISEQKNDNWSAIYCNIKSVDSTMQENIPEQIGISEWIKNPQRAQPIFTIWNVEYLKEIKSKKYGWYDLSYEEGQGATEDMRMYNLSTVWNEWCSPYINVHWYRNNTFREGMGEYSLREYFNKNKEQFNERFKEKYNMNHKEITNYLRTNKRK